MNIAHIDRAVQVRNDLQKADALRQKVQCVSSHNFDRHLIVGSGITSVAVSAAQLTPGTWDKVIELLTADLATQVAEREAIIEAL